MLKLLGFVLFVAVAGTLHGYVNNPHLTTLLTIVLIVFAGLLIASVKGIYDFLSEILLLLRGKRVDEGSLSRVGRIEARHSLVRQIPPPGA
jgi:hypothetical protein